MITTKSETSTTKLKVSPDYERFEAFARKLVSVSKANIDNQANQKKEKATIKKS